MNDLSKEREAILKTIQEGGNSRHTEATSAQIPLHYRKLQMYLLLLYQAYLRAEVELEPALKMALWRMVQFNEGFRQKVEQTQFDILQKRPDAIPTDWELAKEVLFPIAASVTTTPIAASKEKILTEYKETANQLLDHSI